MDDSLNPANLAAPYYDTAPGTPVPKISVRHLNFFYGQDPGALRQQPRYRRTIR